MMAIISTFLCWSNTRTGSAVCGYYTMIVSVICLAFYMLRYIALEEVEDSTELKGIVYTGFVLYSFLIGVSLVLLPGVYMDQKFLLLPWIYVIVITVLYETGAVALTTTVHLEQDHTLHVWEVVAVVFYCARLIANHARHTPRSDHLSESDEYNPPYGAALPPYSEENPYKEYSPPNYENLVQGFEDLGALATSFRLEVPVRSGRMSSDSSFIHLSDAAVNLSHPESTEYSERNRHCDNIEANYSYSSIGGSSDETNDNSSITDLSSLSGIDPPQTLNHQFSQCANNVKINNCTSENTLAMTRSSACLMEYSFDNSSKPYKKPARSKRAQVSPICLQKRTYITWI